MFLSSLFLLAAVECADPDTARGMRDIDRGVPPCEPERVKVPQRPSTASEQARAKRYFDDYLLDGPTARWRFLSVRIGYILCGRVNAKNRFGAYSGWTPFAYDLVEGDGYILGPDESTSAWITLCLDETVIVD